MWLRRHSSVLAVLAIAVAWIALELLAPSVLEAGLHSPWGGRQVIGEGPIEGVELAMLGAAALAWAGVTARAVRTRQILPPVLAASMVVQLLFVLAEEAKWRHQVDWCKVLGFGEWCPPASTLRQGLRYGGVVPELLTSPVAGWYLLAFLLMPLVPLRALRWWERRAAPVSATRPEAVALVVASTAWAAWGFAFGAFPDDELLQLEVYAVALAAGVRIAWGDRPPQQAPAAVPQ